MSTSIHSAPSHLRLQVTSDPANLAPVRHALEPFCQREGLPRGVAPPHAKLRTLAPVAGAAGNTEVRGDGLQDTADQQDVSRLMPK